MSNRLRVLAVAAFAAVATLPAAPALADHADCEQYPDQCYECVQAPCHPDEYPQYLWDLLFGEGS